MNLQQVMPSKSSANGFGRRRGERDGGNRQDNKTQAGKSNPGRVNSAGSLTGVKVGGFESPSRDRLVYLTTCLIGQPVEVQVKNGSIYTGIYHATNTEKDFGVILKMARMTKDGTLRGQKAGMEFLTKAPSKTLIIPGKELVQVVAKDVAITRDGLSNEFQPEKQQELMLDGSISQFRHVDLERELAPWVPDEDDTHHPELDNVFDNPWNRNWDQFEANAALFGVKSTFDEELYTTKLDRGPGMRELEKEAMRIAREIEGEDTQDLHTAEERGIQLHETFDMDEETRYSSVYRGTTGDDSGYEEEEDILLNSRNNETFGGPSDSVNKSFADFPGGKSNNGTRVSSSTSLVDEAQSSQSAALADLYRTASSDHAVQLASEHCCESSTQETVLDEHGVNDSSKVFREKQLNADDDPLSKPEGLQLLEDGNTDNSDKGGLSGDNASAGALPPSSFKGNEKTSAGELSGGPGKIPGETQSVHTHGRPGSSRSSSSERVGATPASGGPGISPSSSVGSLASEKSTLNPHAKEFKLNPNAKSFTPSPPAVRPPSPVSPVSDGSFYYQPNVSTVPHMHGMPVGYGIGPSFTGHQPVIFNPQVAPPQAYFHPNGPQYGQHMLLGQPRQVVYMPSYQPEMPYKGREY